MARQRNDEAKYKRNSKVVAAIDLPDIPAGTPGKVMIVGGLSWIRYFVQFDLGDGVFVDRSLVRQEWLMEKSEFEKQQNEAKREAYRFNAAERQAELAGAGTAAGH